MVSCWCISLIRPWSTQTFAKSNNFLLTLPENSNFRDVRAYYFVTQRLGLHGIRYVQIRLGSDPLFYTGLVRNWNGTVPYRITFISGPDSRSEPYRIHQFPCKHKVYPYQFRNDSKRIRSHVNGAKSGDNNNNNNSSIVIFAFSHSHDVYQNVCQVYLAGNEPNSLNIV